MATECSIEDVEACSEFPPVTNKAVIAFTIRTTFYLQSLLVFFNGSIAAGLYHPSSESSRDQGPMSKRQREEADTKKIDLRRKSGIDALNILIAMNVAMSCTSLVLAHAPRPTLDFHSALVVAYLLVLSWTAIVSVAPFYIRLKVSIHGFLLKFVVFLQGLLIFVFIIMLLARARTFGPSFCCNSTAKAYFFGTFEALGGGRTAGWVMIALVTVVYTAQGLYSCISKKSTGKTKQAKAAKNGTDGTLERGDLQRAGDGDSVPGADGAAEGVKSNEGTKLEVEELSLDADVPDLKAVATEKTSGEEEEDETLIKAAGSANTKLFSSYFVFWIVAVLNTEMLIVRNGFAYDVREGRALFMSDPICFAQSLQFAQVLTFFIPFVHIHDTIQKIRATWMSLRDSMRLTRFTRNRNATRRRTPAARATVDSV